MKTIRAQKAPVGSEQKVKPFVDSLAELARASRTERKSIKRLLKSIGAIPTAPGRGGDEEPAGNDTQDA